MALYTNRYRTIKEGEMYPRKGESSWTPIWLVLDTSGCVSQYKNSQKREKLDEFYLERRAQALPLELEENGKRFPFRLMNFEINWTLAVDDKDTRDEWIDEIEQLASAADPRSISCVLVGDANTTEVMKFLKEVLIVNEAHVELVEKVKSGLMTDEMVFLCQDKKSKEEVLLKLTHVYSAIPINLRQSLYLAADVLLICFSVADRNTFETLEEVWYPELRKNISGRVPRYLVGFASEDHDKGNRRTIFRMNSPAALEVESLHGESLADYIDCKYYYEINVDSGEVFSSKKEDENGKEEQSISDIFDTVLAETIAAKDRRRIKKSIASAKRGRSIHDPQARMKAAMNGILSKVKASDEKYQITENFKSAINKGKEKIKRMSLIYLESRRRANEKSSPKESVIFVDDE